MNKLKIALASLLVVPTLALGTGAVMSQVVLGQAKDSIEKGIGAAGGDGQSDPVNVGGVVGGIVQWLLFAVGAISVIMLIWGGIRYATSAGDSNKVTSAKNTIMYALIGLAVALLAYAIVGLVINSLSGQGIEGPQ